MITPIKTDNNKTMNDAKQRVLDNQRSEIVKRLAASDKSERIATIGHIDTLFTANLSPENLAFWHSVKTDILAIDEKA